MAATKYSFSIDFQFELIRYILREKAGLMALDKVKPEYFTLISHSLMIEAIKKYVKKFKHIPGEKGLVEYIERLLKSKEYANLVIKEDREEIYKNIKNIYKRPVQDIKLIEESIYRFAAYIQVKALTQEMDFSDYSQYENYQNQFSKIIKDSAPHKEEEPLYMVSGVTTRQMKRQVDPDVVPTPYWQLNNLSNGAGYSKGSIFVILDKPKQKKTFSLINIARGYLKEKKNVLYIDTENGKTQIMERMIQSTLNKTRKQMLSGDFDKMEKSHMRKYKRLGVEFVVDRIPALIGNVNHIRDIIIKLKDSYGIKVDILMIDYAAKMASLDRDKDPLSRIDKVYIELDNLANELNIDAIWTAQHVTREGGRHKATRYEDNDIASAISIVRNAQCILGLNSTEEEEANGVQRLEVVVQRDGKPHGRVLFHVDLERQRWKEFTREARTEYDNTQGKIVDEMIKGEGKPQTRKVNKIADPKKANQKGGDL